MAAERRPAVLCIAAGAQQVPVIRAARARGFAVVGVDRDPDAPGFEACDERVVASTHEPGAVAACARALVGRHRFAGVLVRSAGPPVVTAAWASRALGLPGVPVDAARTVVDKERLLAACAREGLPAPAVRSGAALDELDLDALPPPWIVKPALALVGKGAVRRVARRAALADAFEAAREASLTGRVNVEAWVPGADVGLVSAVRDGALHPVVLIDEWNETASDGAIHARGIVAPSRFSGRPEEAAVLELARRIVERFGLRTTAFMMACRVVPGQAPVLTEIHLDLGGDRILDELLPASACCDVLEHLVDLLCGPSPEAGPTGPPARFRPAGLLFDGAGGPAGARGFTLVRADDPHDLHAAMGMA